MAGLGYDLARGEPREDWMSGLNQQFTKLSASQGAREFESHILRQKSKSHFEAESGSARSADTNAFPPPNPESK